MNDTTPPRKVTWLLGSGIAFMPYIFSWFTLRDGYSKKARTISFVWMIVAPLLFGSSSYQQYKAQSVPMAGGILKVRASKCQVLFSDQRMVEFSDVSIPVTLKISNNEICEMVKSFLAHDDENILDSMKDMCPDAKEDMAIRDLASRGNPQAIRLTNQANAFCTPTGKQKTLIEIRRKGTIKIYSLGDVFVGANSCPAILVSTEGQASRGYGKSYKLFAKGACGAFVNDKKSQQFDPNRFPGEEIKSHNYSGTLPTTYTFNGKDYPFLPPSNTAQGPAKQPQADNNSVVAPTTSYADVPVKIASEIPVIDSAPAAQAWTPSFDCAKASNGQERLICSSRELSAADVKLEKAYKWALSNTIDKGVALRKLQNKWRKNERDACSDVGCMLNAYQKRLDELDE